jgi:hypothetical protein
LIKDGTVPAADDLAGSPVKHFAAISFREVRRSLERRQQAIIGASTGRLMANDMSTDGRNTRLGTYNAISPAVEECFPVHRKTSPISSPAASYGIG